MTKHTAPIWQKSPFKDDLSFELQLPSGKPVEPLDNRIVGPLNHADIIRLLFSQARPMQWDSAVDNMCMIRSSDPMPLPFGGGYRPFFVIVEDDKSKRWTTWESHALEEE